MGFTLTKTDHTAMSVRQRHSMEEEEDNMQQPHLTTVKPLPPVTGTTSAIPSRGLTKAVAEKYKVLTSGDKVSLIYTVNGKPAAFKERGLVEKTFKFNGNAQTELFGQAAFSKGGTSPDDVYV